MHSVSDNNFISFFLEKFTSTNFTVFSTFFKDNGSKSPESISSNINLFSVENLKLFSFVSFSFFNSVNFLIATLEPKYISAGYHLFISPKNFIPFCSGCLADCKFADLNSSDIVPITFLSPLK